MLLTILTVLGQIFLLVFSLFCGSMLLSLGLLLVGTVLPPIVWLFDKSGLDILIRWMSSPAWLIGGTMAIMAFEFWRMTP